jgi:hypothetical protein
MEMVFIEESKPVNTLLLIMTKFSLDGDWKFKWFDFMHIKHLRDELPLTIPSTEQFLRQPWRIWNTSFQWYELDKCGESGGSDETNIVVRIRHSTKNRNDQEDNIWQNIGVHNMDQI